MTFSGLTASFRIDMTRSRSSVVLSGLADSVTVRFFLQLISLPGMNSLIQSPSVRGSSAY